MELKNVKDEIYGIDYLSCLPYAQEGKNNDKEPK